jgi:hypothetical protein
MDHDLESNQVEEELNCPAAPLYENKKSHLASEKSCLDRKPDFLQGKETTSDITRTKHSLGFLDC